MAEGTGCEMQPSTYDLALGCGWGRRERLRRLLALLDRRHVGVGSHKCPRNGFEAPLFVVHP